MSSLSPANGSEEKVCKVQVLKLGQYVESYSRLLSFAFYKKTNHHQIRHLGGAFEHNFGPGAKI